jgi:hypothetical protein
MSASSHRQTEPWWRHGMVWLVISGPLVVVIAGIGTAVIAIRGADPIVSAAGAEQPQSRPAVQARNHAATPAPSR